MICPACGTENRPAARFCHGCGAPLPVEAPSAVEPAPPAEPALPEVAAEQHPVEVRSPFTGGVRLTVGQATAQGSEQPVNQDCLLALVLTPLILGRPSPALGFFAVADGMSRASGEVASRLAVQVTAQGVASRMLLCELAGEPCLDETLVPVLVESVEDANAHLCAAARGVGNDLASTLAVALLRDDLAVIASVGDSRVYHWHGGALQQVTTDHSLVERLLETGQITAEEAATHPQRGVLYRSLGDRPEVEVDIFTLHLSPGDRLLLCCDGVWGVLSEEELGEVLAAVTEPQRASDEIVRRAVAAAATDNASVLVIGLDDTAVQAVCRGQEQEKGISSNQKPGGE